MKVLCISNHPIYRDGLALLIRRDYARLEFVHADTCASALAMLPVHSDLRLILVDRVLPRHRTDTECLSVLWATTAGIPMVVMSNEENSAASIDRANGHITAFAPKSSTTEEFLDLLRRLLGDDPDASGRATVPKPTDTEPGMQPAGARVPPRLTMREGEVLALLMRGMENKRIATHLGIACEGTVKQHVSSVLGKLNARNRTEAVMKAVVLGLSPLQPH